MHTLRCLLMITWLTRILTILAGGSHTGSHCRVGEILLKSIYITEHTYDCVYLVMILGGLDLEVIVYSRNCSSSVHYLESGFIHNV